MRVAICLIVFTLLVACSPGDLVTAYKLRNVDPFVTEAEGLRVAVKVPAALRPMTEEIAVTGELQAEGEAPLRENFALEAAASGPLEDALAKDVSSDEHVFFFQLAPASLSAFEDFRREAQRLEDSDADGAGSLGVHTAVCRDGAEMPARIPVTVYLKAAEVSDYVRLTHTGNILADVAPEYRDVVAPRCP